MPVTYKKIASVTVGAGGAANIEFTGIPATYDDLVLFFSGRSTGDNTFTTWRDVDLTFNNSSSGYSSRAVQGNGSTAGSETRTNESTLALGSAIPDSATTASTFSNCFIYITNYAGSTNKSISMDNVTENNATQALAMLNAGIWANTAAITSIKLDPSVDNLAQYSSAILYGIKKS